MSRTPLFSVIVPTYNRSSFLSEAVNSVLAQTFPDHEVVVVDDASTEPVAQVTTDPRVRVVRRSRNGGATAARNTGIAEARGAYITFLDDDDRITPDRLSMVVGHLAAADVVLCWTGYLDDHDHRPGRMIHGVPGGELLSGPTPHMGSAVVRRDSIELLDESYRTMEDVEWWLRMSNRSMVTVPAVGYLWRRHDGWRVDGPAERIEGAKRLLRDHAVFFDANPAAAAYRWKWIGRSAARIGRRTEALDAYRAAFRLSKDLRLLGHAARLLWA